MADKFDYWKLITGEKFEETVRIPTLEETVRTNWKELQTNYPLIRLGVGSDGDFPITEEERESHMHIIGATGEGKSYFLQHLIRHDIDRGQGFCFLDPTGGAKTLKDVLKYCCKKKIEKVCLIDPYDYFRFKKVPIINPLLSDKEKPWLHKYSVSNVRDAARVLTGQKDPGDTMIINKYLKSLLWMLVDSEMSLYDALYFTEYDDYRVEREAIYQNCDPENRHVRSMVNAFRSPATFNALIGSTSRRIDDLFDPPLKWMFGSNEGITDKSGRQWEFIDFEKMVADNWIILINLDTTGGADPLETRFLGTIVINEIISAIDRLRHGTWNKKYYLYIDEAQEYANRKLQDILDKKRNLGLRLVFAHHTFAQFEDKRVENSIVTNAKIKVAFFTGAEDRDRLVKMLGYGGELKDRDVAYQLGKLKRQEAVIRNNKQPPQIVKIENVEPVDVPEKELDEYKHKIYQRKWYKTPLQVEQEIKQRFNGRPIQKDTKSSKPRAAHDRTADSPPALSRGVQSRRRKDIPAGDEKSKEAGKGRPIKI